MRNGILGKYHIVYDKKYKIISKILFLLLIILVTLQVVYPKLVEKLLSSIEADLSVLYKISAFIIGICIIKAVVSIATELLSNYLFVNLNISLKNRLIEKIFRLCVQDSMAFNPGELTQTYCNDVDAVINYISNVILSLIINLLMISGIIIVSVMTNTLLGFSLILISAVTFIALSKINRYAVPFWDEQRGNMEKFYSYLYEILGLIKELNLSGNQSYIAESFGKMITKISKSNFLSALMGYHLWVASIICFSVTKWALVLAGGILVYKNRLNAATIFLYTYYLDMLTSPIETLRVNLQSVQVADASLERIKKILDIDNNAIQYGDKEIGGKTSVEFREVLFSYKKDPILDGLNMNLEENEMVALVGKSGSGKTTVVKLICRLYDAQVGMVLINNKDIKEYTKESLTKNIEYIRQMIELEGISVKNALGLYDPDKVHLFMEYLRLFDLMKYKINLDERWKTYGYRYRQGIIKRYMRLKL